MRRSRVQYRSAKPARQAFGLRPARLTIRSPCLRCARPVGLRYRRAGALGRARLSARRMGQTCLTPGCARLQRPGCAWPRASPPPRPSAGSPPARTRGTLLRRAPSALRAPVGGCAPGRPPTRLRRAWPPVGHPSPGCARLGPFGAAEQGAPRPCGAGGDGGCAPHRRPGRWGGPRGLGASHGHPATGRFAPSRLRASRPVALARRASAGGSPRPPAQSRRGGAAPPAPRPPRVRGYAPDTPQGQGRPPPPPYPHPPAGDPRPTRRGDATTAPARRGQRRSRAAPTGAQARPRPAGPSAGRARARTAVSRRGALRPCALRARQREGVPPSPPPARLDGRALAGA